MSGRPISPRAEEAANVSQAGRIDLGHGAAEQDIAGMTGAGDVAADRADTRTHQTPAVKQPLVTLRIELIDRNDVWRQSGQAGITGELRPAGGVV
jgi:hypothetical protein